MPHHPLTIAMVVVLAFCVGFATQRGNICGLLAARQIVETRRFSRLVAFVTASIWALVVVVPLSWLTTGFVALAPSLHVSAITAAGGALYGVGTVINGACVFGTASRILSGNVSFLGALPGIALGAGLGVKLGLPSLAGMNIAASPLHAPGPLALGLLAIASVIAVAALNGVLRSHARAGLSFGAVARAGRWRTSLAMMIIGVCGGVLFASGTPWAYPALLRQVGVMALGRNAVFATTVILGPVALAMGVLAGAALGGRVTRRPVSTVQVARSFVGGAAMALAATFIPGGNDVLLLGALPSLALHGAVAYVSMLATQILVLAATMALRRG